VSENCFIEIPVYPESISFAAGPKNQQGLGMKIFRNDELVQSSVSVPVYMARQGNLVHEGILSTMIDEVMAWAVLVFLRLNVFTKSITMNYHKPVEVMDMLRVEARLKERTGEREAVVAGEIYNSRGELCVSSTGVFSLLTRDFVKKLALADDTEMEYCWALFDSIENNETI